MGLSFRARIHTYLPWNGLCVKASAVGTIGSSWVQELVPCCCMSVHLHVRVYGSGHPGLFF